MIKSGLSWHSALIIIGLANIIITIPMVLNGHAGVKYGIPFPVLGRAAFGINGIHVASILRAIVACGWFGVQTWIGGLAFYAIWNAITGNQASIGLDLGKFIGFGLFWLVNLYFIWNGTESIKWLESFAAPILILIGILLIIWGSNEAGGFKVVMEQGKQLEKPTALLYNNNGILEVQLTPLKNVNGNYKADEFQISVPISSGEKKALGWQKIEKSLTIFSLPDSIVDDQAIKVHAKTVDVQFRKISGNPATESSIISLALSKNVEAGSSINLWSYILWLTAMVGFWATMSLSIADPRVRPEI